MRMRTWLAALAGFGLASCVTAPSGPPRLAFESVPRTPLPLDDAGVLFWDQKTRRDRFARLEDFYAGLLVEPADDFRELPAGAPIGISDIAAIDRQLEAMNAVGIVILQNGRVRYSKTFRRGNGSLAEPRLPGEIREHPVIGGTMWDTSIYRRPVDPRWTSFSVAKSFTSTLLGAAVKDGALALSDPVTKHLPGLAGTAYDGVTVEQVATMTSGVKWNEDYTDPKSDVARMLLVAPVADEPQSVTYARTLTREAPAGQKWVYKTLETNLLGDIVSAATGKSLAAYAKEKIVDPAGFRYPLFWMVDRTERNIGGCCISLQLSDYARMGQWVLEGGQPSVPEGWFERAGGERVAIGGGLGYGYQWWTSPMGFGAQGIFGQYITIVPSERVVIAVVSNYPTATGRGLTEARNALWKAAIAAVKR